LDNIHTRSHKYMKELGKLYIRPITELQQCEYDVVSQRFRDLRCAVKGMHRLKYAHYIERVEAGLKCNPRCFFISSGYPFVMFLGDTCTRNAQKVVDLLGEYGKGVYVRDNLQEDFVVDGAAVLRILPLFC
jgi:hypothetical protein